jgi:hypothetical protein
MFPILGRSSSHRGGTDIKLLLQPRDIDIQGGSDFYVEYAPKEVEFRVHVFCGRIIKISEKRRDGGGDYDPVCWNLGSGWTFMNPSNETPPAAYQAVAAVMVHKLDFGAVDIMMSAEGEAFVLEVNTAPGLHEHSLEIYGEALREELGLSDVPGIENVDFE